MNPAVVQDFRPVSAGRTTPRCERFVHCDAVPGTHHAVRDEVVVCTRRICTTSAAARADDARR
jgi:hypothetical protein